MKLPLVYFKLYYLHLVSFSMSLRIKRIQRLFVFVAFYLCASSFTQSVANDDVYETKEALRYQEIFNQAKQSYQAGKFYKAISQWQTLLQETSNTKGESNSHQHINAQLGIASAYQNIGLYSESIKSLNEAKALVNQLNQPITTAQWLNQSGNLAISTGNDSNAIDYFKKALTLVEGLNAPELKINILNNYANALQIMGRYDDAMTHYQNARTLSQHNELNDEAINALLNIIRLKISDDDSETVPELITIAAKDIQILSTHYEQAQYWTTLSVLALDYQQNYHHRTLSSEIYRWLTNAVRFAENHNDRKLLSYVLGYQGKIYEQQERYEEARYLTQRALFISQQEQVTDSEYVWYWQLGRIYKAMGKTNKAIEAYRSSVSGLRPIREEITQGFGRNYSFFQHSVRPVYLELSELLLTAAQDKHKLSESQPLLKETQDIIETLRTVEMEDYFRDECVVENQEKTYRLKQLPGSTALIYPIMLPDRLALLVNINDKLSQISVSVNANHLSNTSQRFRQYLQAFYKNDYKRVSQQLYDWLIRPIEQQFNENTINTLIIVPGGALRNIPFAALHDGNQFLIEKYAIANSPGLSIINPQPLPKDSLSILLAGLSESVQNFSPLPQVNQELASINQNYTATTLLNKTYTKDNLIKTLRNNPFSIVHIATHGKFSEKPENSYLLTHEDRITLTELGQLLKQTQFRDSAVELLIMSACETAVGNHKSSLGMAGIALQSGARSTIASLWQVSDKATSTLMDNLYSHLNNKSLSKAKALQQSQQALIRKNGYDHPYYWAPFLLIGNWM